MQKDSTVTAQNLLTDLHVILVEPSEPLNVGSVARAMMNFGYSNLHIVGPSRYSRERAAITACWADSLLDSLVLHQSLPEAVLSMKQVVGFSAQADRGRAEHVTLSEWVSIFSKDPVWPTALVFGPEDNGLRQEHFSQCRWLVRLPSVNAYESFNLAQAVLLALYELKKALQLGSDSIKPENSRALPSSNEFQQLDRLIELVATESGFFHHGTPAPVPYLMKKLIRRMDPDEHELRVLLGFFNRVEGVLSGRVPGSKDLTPQR